MRKILSFIMIAALMFTSIAMLPPNLSYAADPTPTVKKYHLDMGIWVADKSHQGNSYKYTANLSFNNNVKITGVMSIEEARDIKHIDVFDESVCTNNLSRYFDKDPQGAYEKTYLDYVSTSITNRQIKQAEGKNVSYTADVVLKSPEYTYNLSDIYRQYYIPLSEAKQTTWVPDPSALNRIKQLQSEIDALSAKITRYIELRDAAAHKDQEYAYRFYQSCVWNYTNQRSKLQAIKASIKTGYEKETVVQLFEFDTENFVDDVFKFWGAAGRDAGSGYAYLKSAAPSERNVPSEYSIFTALDAMLPSQSSILIERGGLLIF